MHGGCRSKANDGKKKAEIWLCLAAQRAGIGSRPRPFVDHGDRRLRGRGTAMHSPRARSPATLACRRTCFPRSGRAVDRARSNVHGCPSRHAPQAYPDQFGPQPLASVFSGGRYLFDTAEHAREYRDWVFNSYVLDGVLFLKRSYFLSPECHAWTVIGAHDFGDVHSSQIVLRTERWSLRNAR